MKNSIFRFLSITFLALVGISIAPQMARAEIAFVSATNAVSLLKTVTEDSQQIFVFQGLADGDSADFTFSIDTACPLIAMTGGAKFTGNWSCTGGAITASVTNQGGMTFGPRTDEPDGSFYITFNDPPTPPGGSADQLADLAGIQLSVYGDIQSWNLTGNMTSSGVSFGVELSGPEGGAAHFRMDLPQAAVTFLGGTIGVTVGGKSDPFSTVTNNEDGSVSLAVDIAHLKSSAAASAGAHIKTRTVTKKIMAGKRKLSIAATKSKVKPGATLSLAMCSGGTFTAGDKVPVTFLVNNQARKTMKASFQLDSSGCDTVSVKLSKALNGALVSRIKYKGKTASVSVTVHK